MLIYVSGLIKGIYGHETPVNYVTTRNRFITELEKLRAKYKLESSNTYLINGDVHLQMSTPHGQLIQGRAQVIRKEDIVGQASGFSIKCDTCNKQLFFHYNSTPIAHIGEPCKVCNGFYEFNVKLPAYDKRLPNRDGATYRV